MRRAPFLLAALCAPLLVGSPARADNYDTLVVPATPAPEETPAAGAKARSAPVAPPEVDKPAQRRSGVVLGFHLGVGLASSSGYPNNSNDIGDPNYYAASGLMTGSGGTFFLMGALTDYLSFGFWGGQAKFGNGQWYSSGGGGGLRLEVFPGYSLGGPFRDLGVSAQVGIGATTLVNKQIGTAAGAPAIDQTGVGSFLAVGAFYEFWLVKALGGHFAIGPNLEYDTIFSESMERHGAMLGVRFLWYGGK